MTVLGKQICTNTPIPFKFNQRRTVFVYICFQKDNDIFSLVKKYSNFIGPQSQTKRKQT